jgi:hypothetical protein
VRLTNDCVLDRSPSIAAPASDDVLAVWVKNASNDLFGSATAPNSVMWSHCDGTQWGAPAAIASGIGTILNTTLAYDGLTGTYVFCVDSDDDLDTTADEELWAASYAGGVWSAPTRLTNDDVMDSSPRLFYDSGGALKLAWLKGSDFCIAAGTDAANAEVVGSPGESYGARDFDVIADASGRLVLLWSDASKTYSDLWTVYYDAAESVWSKPRQLTFEDSSECSAKGAFLADGKLLAIYGKTLTNFVDKTVTVNGQEVVVPGVPEAGRTDLCYMTYEMGCDLSVAVEDVGVLPVNPEPGTQASITGTIRNLGEAAASDVEVAFYDGDPQAGGTLIGTVQTIAGPVQGGGEGQASATWDVSATLVSHHIYTVVDPNQTQEDRDRTNNVCSFPVVMPDLTIQGVGIEQVGPKKYVVTGRVANEGQVPLENVALSMRLGSTTGQELSADTVASLAPAAFHDFSYE